MDIVFDPAKDAADIAEHGVSLADFAGSDDEPNVAVDDRYDYGEVRYQARGRIDGVGYCLVFAIDDGTVRRSASAASMKRRCAGMDEGAPPEGHDDNPEWTEETTARARPAGEWLPAAIIGVLVKNKGGRPRGSNKEQVALRIDRDVLERFRSGGPGWQTRINEALRKAAP